MATQHLDAIIKRAQKARLARAELRDAIREAHAAGESLARIGEAARLSKQRIHQIIREEEADDA
jgi:hypothetical protein